MPPTYLLDDFTKLLRGSQMDDDGIECIMRDGYFCFEMMDICDYFGIDIKFSNSTRNKLCVLRSEI